jgi:hypothetical protein
MSSGDPRDRDPRPNDAEGGDDFGSRVSSTVRSSADLFNLPPKGSPDSTRKRASDPDASLDSGSEQEDPARRERPPRYWRDSLSSPMATDVEDEEFDDENYDDGGEGGGYGGFLGDGGPSRRFLIIIGAIIVALIVAFLVYQMMNDDGGGGDDPTPTSTLEPVIGTLPADEATNAPDEANPTRGAQGAEPTGQPTREVQQGGDNQLGGQDDEPEGDSTPTDSN